MKILWPVFLAAALAPAQTARDAQREAAIRAFHDIAAVLTSPRCLNCHVPGDSPLQGDDNHVHNMKVVRGSDGSGSPAMRCTNCHQEANVAAPHAPPGAPEWRMPKAPTPMAWQGLSLAQLCRSLKDPASNGNRSLQDLVEHAANDKIVNWGWNPGPGRVAPPLPHTEFVERVRTWAAAGGPCPE